MPEETQTLSRGTPEGRPIRPSRPATGTDTVTVACKISNGLVLRLYEMAEVGEAVFGGGERTIKKAFQVGEDVVLRGCALEQDSLRAGRMPGYPHVGGYALTSGVSREFWEKWLEQNKDLPAVKNHLVFADENLNNATDMAREREEVQSGYEGIDPADPSKRTGIRAVSPADRPR